MHTNFRRVADRALEIAVSTVAMVGTLLLIGFAVSMTLLAMVFVAALVFGGA